MKAFRNLLAGGLLLGALGTAGAQTTTWTATGTSSWSTGANWSNGTPEFGYTAIIDNGQTAEAGVTVSSTFANVHMGTSSGNGGTLNITGGNIYAGQFGRSVILGEAAGGYGIVNVSSGTWRTDGIEAGYSGTGTITVTGGRVLSAGTVLGWQANSQGTVNMSSGTWNNSSMLYVGRGGTGSFNLSGGLLTTASGANVGSDVGSNGIITVSGGTWNNANQVLVGSFGTGEMVISGGTVTNERAMIGSSIESNGTVTVTGEDATWNNNENLYVGNLSSNNTLTIEDGGLVTVLGSLQVAGGNDNFIRLDDGYLAMWGSQVSSINSLISNGNFQVWNGTEWVTSTNANDFSFGYFATDAAAEAFTGRQGLGNYTIVSNAVPEPSTWALLGLGALMLGYTARRRKVA